jgi:hypothetical protein
VRPADPDYYLQQSLDCISEMTNIFRDLRQTLYIANAAWNRFNGHRGDVRYFDHLHDGNACDALHKIEESFELSIDLQIALEAMLQTCSEVANVFTLRLRHAKHGMSRAMTGATADAAASAAKSQEFAEEMARTSRVNMQLLIITTAVVIALQYFCSDQALFSFERNPRTFWIGLCILVFGLILLFLFLHALDHVKLVSFDRWYGKLEKAFTPVIEPVR